MSTHSFSTLNPSSTTQVGEARSSVPSTPGKSVPSPRYLYGIILVVIILAIFVCFCTAREVLRRQRRWDGPRPVYDPGRDEEEVPEKMVKPEMYEVYLDDTAHVFHDISDEPLRWKNIKPLSTSFVPQPPANALQYHESFSAALGALIANKLPSLGMRTRKAIWLKEELDERTPISRSTTPAPGLILAPVFISMPTPSRRRSHAKRPSFAISEISGERTLYECPVHSEEIVFGIHEGRRLQSEDT